MNYASIRKMDISNGQGIGVALFVQGCDFHCDGCFNKETWDFSKGKQYTEFNHFRILELCFHPYIKRLSILGGECLHENNIADVAKLCKSFKVIYPKKKLWIWTGYTMAELIKIRTSGTEQGAALQTVMRMADYIIDGRYDKSKRDLTKKYRGSVNQMIWHNVNGEWQDITNEID